MYLSLDAGPEIGKCTLHPGCGCDAVELRKGVLCGRSNRGNANQLRMSHARVKEEVHQ